MDNNNFAFTFNNLDSKEERTLNKLPVLPMTPSKPESFTRQLYFHLDLGFHGEDEQKGKESFQPISSAIKVKFLFGISIKLVKDKNNWIPIVGGIQEQSMSTGNQDRKRLITLRLDQDGNGNEITTLENYWCE
ncbi:11836_t:CDS:2 [Funneliformis caledonium]|uniref:11836_t:CDS:1 n=1 Tax=Funneliformis caledonium TaxID=1117310 RepID=A0A9N8VI83_9GLOM|nr:11836_t:CDS:2 [Funneliformis caledonium]